MLASSMKHRQLLHLPAFSARQNHSVLLQLCWLLGLTSLMYDSGSSSEPCGSRDSLPIEACLHGWLPLLHCNGALQMQ